MSAIHTVARAVIVDQEYLLLCKALRNNISYYIMPGGHIEYYETAQEALMRELQEEIGFTTFTISRFLGCLEYFDSLHSIPCHNHEYNLIFQASSPEVTRSTPLPALENHTLEWIALKDLPSINLKREPFKQLIPSWLAGTTGPFVSKQN